MFGRRIFLLGAAHFMVGFTRPSGAAESRTLVAFFSRLPEMPSGADAVTHATAFTGNVEEAAKTIGALTGADLMIKQKPPVVSLNRRSIPPDFNLPIFFTLHQ